MAGSPPGAAHGQPRLPALTLIGSGRLSNSFFDTPRLQFDELGKLLTRLSIPEQDAALDGAKVAGCCNMPQPCGVADGNERIALPDPNLEGRQPARGEQTRHRRR